MPERENTKKKMGGGKPLWKRSDKAVYAEMKNQTANARLLLEKKVLNRQCNSSQWGIDRDMRQAILAIRRMRHTSGVSKEGVPPDGPGDTKHEKTKYFRGHLALSEKRLQQWRTTEVALERERLAEQIEQQLSELEQEEDATEKFAKMMRLLGYDIDDSAIKRAVERMRNGLESGHNAKKIMRAIEPSQNTMSDKLDVFESLKLEIDPTGDDGNVHKSEKSQDSLVNSTSRPLTPASRKTSRADSPSFSACAWEKAYIGNYLDVIGAPVSLGRITRSVRAMSTSIVSDRCNLSKVRKGSLPSRSARAREIPKISPKSKSLAEHSKNDSRDAKKTHTPADNIDPPPDVLDGTDLLTQAKHLMTNGCTVRDDEASGLTDDNISKINHTHIIPTNAPTQETSEDGKLFGSGASKREEMRRILKRQASSRFGKCFDYGRPTKVSLQPINNASGKKVQIREPGPSDDYQVVHGERNDQKEGSTLAQTEDTLDKPYNYEEESTQRLVPRWKKDLMREAPPSVYSSNEPIKISLVMSKSQRQRELDRLVVDNRADKKIIADYERSRRLENKVNMFITISTLEEAASVVCGSGSIRN